MRFVAFIVLCAALCGCVGQEKTQYVCWDGSVVDDVKACPAYEMPSTSVRAASTTYATTTQMASTTTVTSATVTSSTRATSSTTTSTVSSCGNGVQDPGEECDIGTACPGLDGVCSISGKKPGRAVCMSDGSCQWNAESFVYSGYDMGACSGCFGPKNQDGCRCIPSNLLATVAPASSAPTRATIRPASTTVPAVYPGEYHFECSEGSCIKVMGRGQSTCMTDPQCTHKECRQGRCISVNGQGSDQCEYEHGDCWHYECVNGPHTGAIQVFTAGVDEKDCYA